MRIAYIGHSYHSVTKSTTFFLDLLRILGEVDIFYDDAWQDGPRTWRAGFVEEYYDIIVIFQAFEVFELLSGRHPNMVFVPMYDAMMDDGRFHWPPLPTNVRCVSFSLALHQNILAVEGISRYFQYFPDPQSIEFMTRPEDSRRAFFWYRVASIDYHVISELCADTHFDLLTVQNAPDPSEKSLVLSPKSAFSELHIFPGSSNRNRFRDCLQQHDVFFAPRLSEGIGMTFLEAMAAGMCVVAPNDATMNEYIANGTNGLLYSPNRLHPLNFQVAGDMGLRARESIERGFRKWQASRDAFLSYIATTRDQKHKLFAYPPFETLADHNKPTQTRVSVVVVCKNAAAHLDDAIERVLAQSCRSNRSLQIEPILIDLGSADNTIDVIKQNNHRIHRWKSFADIDRTDAMNNALAYCTGDWVLFITASDILISDDSIARLLAKVPPNTGVVYGHHLRSVPGQPQQYCPAADFDLTWDRLQSGNISREWLYGIPACHAIAIKRDLLEDYRLDTSYRLAAFYELLCRLKRDNVAFYNSDELVSLAVVDECLVLDDWESLNDWREVSLVYGEPNAVHCFFEKVVAERLIGDAEKNAEVYGTRAEIKARVRRWIIRFLR